MKVKNIKIGIASTQEILDKFKKTCEAIERGESPKKSAGIYFEDVHTLESVLTEKRLNLLRTIKERKPKSIYELAKILQRDVKNVSNDVNKLSELGLITLTKSKEGRERVTPTVDYDKILLEIPISDKGSVFLMNK
jgi:predicted transcriptional regulator